jgi:hypothetical protein
MPSTIPTPEAIRASFIHPKIGKIIGRPTFKDLWLAQKLQEENAVEIETTIGGGQHGYLGAIVNAATYARIVPGTPWVAPPNPGAFANVPANATVAQTRVITEQHTEELRMYQEHHAVQMALKQQLHELVETAFMEGYKEPHRGFSGRTAGGTWEWLYLQYGQLSPTDKQKNTANFQKDWDPTVPFEAFAAAMDECVEIAQVAGTPISEEQVLDNALALVFKTALYFDALKEWNCLPVVNKTWNNFKAHMSRAQAELIEEQNTTARSGFGHQQQANAATEQLEATTEALANLATAMAAAATIENRTMTDLTNQNNTLTQQVKECLALMKKMAAADTSKNATGAIRTKQNTRPPPNLNPNAYCWTHGYRIASGHDSMTCHCGNPEHAMYNPLHKKEATRANTMGGTDKGKP